MTRDELAEQLLISMASRANIYSDTVRINHGNNAANEYLESLPKLAIKWAMDLKALEAEV